MVVTVIFRKQLMWMWERPIDDGEIDASKTELITMALRGI